MKVYLIGYMGVGKSSIGKRLAQRMNFTYFDLDLFIVKSQNQSISNLFSKIGEKGFRQIERRALLDEIKDRTIVSTGGGAPCYKNNMDEILKNGIVVWLQMPLKTILSRLKSGKIDRPLIAKLSDSELIEFVEKNLEEREKIYCKADIHFNAMNMNQNKMDELELAIKNYSK